MSRDQELTMGDVEEAGGEDGRAEEAEEDASRDEIVADVLSTRRNQSLSEQLETLPQLSVNTTYHHQSLAYQLN